MLTFLKLLQKADEEGTLPNSFYKVTIMLLVKAKTCKKKKKENYKPISLMNIDVEILHKLCKWKSTEHYKDYIS